MCLYPQLIKNRKYTPNKKNGGNPPPIKDPRTEYVPIGCGDCMECRKQKARNWQIRLQEEIKENKNGKFITLTFSNEWYKKIVDNTEQLKALEHITELQGYSRDNAIATAAIRLFLERYRKKYKKSLRHWLVTELGHNGTENIHLHGIIWTNVPLKTIEEIWQYGWMWKGKEQYNQFTKRKEIINYVSARTINYIVKYITKKDNRNSTYKSIVLTSPGIGAKYIGTHDFNKNVYNDNNTNTTYRTSTGHKISLPIYYRNKRYSEEEREKLWLQTLDQNTRYVCGEKIDISKNENEYWATLKFHQKRNKQLGYGDGTKTWDQVQYEEQRRNLLNEQRKKAAKEDTTSFIKGKVVHIEIYENKQ